MLKAEGLSFRTVLDPTLKPLSSRPQTPESPALKTVARKPSLHLGSRVLEEILGSGVDASQGLGFWDF